MGAKRPIKTGRIYFDIEARWSCPCCYNSLPQSPITGQPQREKGWATGQKNTSTNEISQDQDATSFRASCAHVYKLMSIAAASILTTANSSHLALLSASTLIILSLYALSSECAAVAAESAWLLGPHLRVPAIPSSFSSDAPPATKRSSGGTVPFVRSGRAIMSLIPLSISRCPVTDDRSPVPIQCAAKC